MSTKSLTHKAIAEALSDNRPLTGDQRAALLTLVADDAVWQREADRLRAKVEELRTQIDMPHTRDFAQAVVLEAAHQRKRWGAQHDAGKAPEDWFWLLGYLGGKALHAAKSGMTEKALHHTISSAAALANWHAALSGLNTSMRPGIDPTARGLEGAAIDAAKGGE